MSIFKLTKERILDNTYWSSRHVEDLRKNLDDYDKDRRQDVRLRQLECKSCFYLKSGLAGQAFTEFECKNCDDKTYHPNTQVPKYCNKCAEEHKACKRCGSSI